MKRIWPGLLVACLGCGEGPVVPMDAIPFAIAGDDQTEDIVVGSVVVLDASASSDPEGNSLSYRWSLVAKPVGSTTELIGATDSIATIFLDEIGVYVAVLVVNDGLLDSTPDTVTVDADGGAPALGIDEFAGSQVFADLTVVFDNALAVTGTVDDPTATVTVNGVAATVAGSAYSASITLQPGDNQVAVIAQNAFGEASITRSVVYLGLNPTLQVSSPTGQEPVIGPEYDTSTLVPDTHPIRVTGLATVSIVSGAPTIVVNGVQATVTPRPVPCLIVKCFSFQADLSLAKGPATITAVSGTLTATVSTLVDYCIKSGRRDGIRSEIGNQGNRCNEVDGCSVYWLENGLLAQGTLRNDPMPFALRNAASTEFGDGKVPPEEFFIHGLRPARSLPCNNHDVCYQTLGTTQAGCDYQMWLDMNAVCLRAYPPTQTSPIERAQCYLAADAYHLGLSQLGANAHAQRQAEYGPG